MRANVPKPAKSIPSIREWPLVGSLPAFVGKNPLAFLLDMAHRGDVCGFHLGPFPLVLVNNADYVQRILVEHADDLSKGRLIHRAFGGNGLFVSEGDFHRRQRKVIAPVFQPRQIATYAETMVRYGERLQQEWHDDARVR